MHDFLLGSKSRNDVYECTGRRATRATGAVLRGRHTAICVPIRESSTSKSEMSADDEKGPQIDRSACQQDERGISHTILVRINGTTCGCVDTFASMTPHIVTSVSKHWILRDLALAGTVTTCAIPCPRCAISRSLMLRHAAIAREFKWTWWR